MLNVAFVIIILSGALVIDMPRVTFVIVMLSVAFLNVMLCAILLIVLMMSAIMVNVISHREQTREGIRPCKLILVPLEASKKQGGVLGVSKTRGKTNFT